jgi:DNA-directed RNA polymerase I subunit RPA1
VASNGPATLGLPSSFSTMNISKPLVCHISGVDFDFLSSTDIKSLSVKRVINPITFNSLLHPNPGGLHDPALGSFRNDL